MATLNLGRIKPVFRGAYAGGTAYVVDDIVTSGNETFICILASTGNATSNATYWTKLAAKGTDGTDVGTTITTQGDILFRDGSGLQRLAKGTASQQLAMNAGATAPEWVTVSGGAIKQMKQVFWKEWTDMSSSTSYATIDTDFKVEITPTAADSSFWIQAIILAGHSNNDSHSGFNIFDSQVGTSNGDEIFGVGLSSGSYHPSFMTSKWGLNSSSGVDNYYCVQSVVQGLYTPASNNANARTFYPCSFNPQQTAQFNRGRTDHQGSISANSHLMVWEIANGIYS